MKVVILAGDRGIRLREDTEFRSKALTSLGGMPVISHIMKLYSNHGFNDFILCVGEWGPEIEDYFKKNPVEGLTLSFQDTRPAVMTGSILKKTKPLLEKGEDFFLSYCDTISNVDIDKLLKFHKAMGRVITVTGAHPTSPLGVVEAEDGLATYCNEKARLKGMVKGGFYVCKYDIFDYLTDEGEFMFEEKILPKLVEEKQVAVFEHNDFWYRVDTFKDVEFLEKLWSSGKAPWKVW